MIFYFFNILIFQVVRGVKGQKIAQNDKKLRLVALCISGTVPHMIHILVHIGKMMTSAAVSFVFFKLLILGAFRGGVKGQKRTHN